MGYIRSIALVGIAAATILSCRGRNIKETEASASAAQESTGQRAKEAVIEKSLIYDQHTLADTYPYDDTIRVFQWEQIKHWLTIIDSAQSVNRDWAVLKNRRNSHGEAPMVEHYMTNDYHRVADIHGVERYQSVPLYDLGDTIVPDYYDRDGSLVKYAGEQGNFVIIEDLYQGGRWEVPEKYVDRIETPRFEKVIFVDRTNQNIATLEKQDGIWLVRSMNPATTGRKNPPYAYETPLGIFVIQDKQERMTYLRDGSDQVGGFAPWASRFSNGGYIHGVPTNSPSTSIIEFSNTLGTVPRSHMCVRNASSHARFIYDWAPVEQALVIVIE